jgi:DNA replication protein DnaC
MNNLFDQMRAASNPNVIRIPFDPDRTPHEQIETAIASVKARVCERHPHEILPVDKTATIRSALRHDYPNEDQPHRVEFTAIYERCPQCPHNDSDHDIEVERCAVGVVRFGNRDYSIRDEQGRPLPKHSASAALVANRCARDQFDAWLASTAGFRCPFSNQVLHRRDARMKLPFETLAVVPQFIACLRCRLERLGITPDESRASFDGFLVDPPALQQHLDACRAFAAAPKGVLLLLGNCGTGKTHLAIAIMRELLRRGTSDQRFVKHRHFLAQHWLALRPVAFREEPPESPLARCQEAALLVYDELTVGADSRSYEDVLLDLFEHRIGHFKPSVITANVGRAELEAALGTRLFDRLRRASFALLEFGFESKRPNFNTDYLDRPGKP